MHLHIGKELLKKSLKDNLMSGNKFAPHSWEYLEAVNWVNQCSSMLILSINGQIAQDASITCSLSLYSLGVSRCQLIAILIFIHN